MSTTHPTGSPTVVGRRSCGIGGSGRRVVGQLAQDRERPRQSSQSFGSRGADRARVIEPVVLPLDMTPSVPRTTTGTVRVGQSWPGSAPSGTSTGRRG